VATRKEIATVKVDRQAVESLAFAGDNILAATLGRYIEDVGYAHGKVLVLDRQLRVRKELQGHMAVAVGKDGTVFAGEDGENGAGKVLRIQDGKSEVWLDELPDQALNLPVSPDGQRLALGTFGEGVGFADLATKRITWLNVQYHSSYNCVAWAGKDLAVIDFSGWLTLWSPDGKHKDSKAIEAKGFSVAADAKNVVVGTATGDLLIFSLDDGLKPARTIQHAHKGVVYAIALSPDGKWMVSGGEDGQVVFHAW
jgi:WD40 repeat protein